MVVVGRRAVSLKDGLPQRKGPEHWENLARIAYRQLRARQVVYWAIVGAILLLVAVAFWKLVH